MLHFAAALSRAIIAVVVVVTLLLLAQQLLLVRRIRVLPCRSTTPFARGASWGRLLLQVVYLVPILRLGVVFAPVVSVLDRCGAHLLVVV